MSEELWCTECPYFGYVADDMDNSWYGTKCYKDGHEANPSMYAVQSLHDDCPLRNTLQRSTPCDWETAEESEEE